MTLISPVVLFIGGPKDMTTEHIANPPPHIQVPEQIKSFVGIVPSYYEDVDCKFKVVTYRREKYYFAPGIFLPIYVVQGIDLPKACELAGEFFLSLIIQSHLIGKNMPKQNGKTAALMSIMDQEWYKQAISAGPTTQEMPDMLSELQKAMALFEKEVYNHSIDSHYKQQFMMGPPSTGKQKKQQSGSKVIGNLVKLIPNLATAKSTCPECGGKDPVPVVDLITHLNDTHMWPIKTKIADWLETLDTKFEVKQ